MHSLAAGCHLLRRADMMHAVVPFFFFASLFWRCIFGQRKQNLYVAHFLRLFFRDSNIFGNTTGMDIDLCLGFVRIIEQDYKTNCGSCFVKLFFSLSMTMLTYWSCIHKVERCVVAWCFIQNSPCRKEKIFVKIKVIQKLMRWKLLRTGRKTFKRLMSIFLSSGENGWETKKEQKNGRISKWQWVNETPQVEQGRCL